MSEKVLASLYDAHKDARERHETNHNLAIELQQQLRATERLERDARTEMEALEAAFVAIKGWSPGNHKKDVRTTMMNRGVEP